MGNKKGKIMYLPPVIIDEMEDIKREDDIVIHAEAFRKLVKYARVGREIKRLSSFGYDWKKKIKLPKVDSYPLKKGKYKKNPRKNDDLLGGFI